MAVKIPIELDRYEDLQDGRVAVLHLTADPRYKAILPAELFEGSTEVNFVLVESPATTEEEKALIEDMLKHLRK